MQTLYFFAEQLVFVEQNESTAPTSCPNIGQRLLFDTWRIILNWKATGKQSQERLGHMLKVTKQGTKPEVIWNSWRLLPDCVLPLCIELCNYWSQKAHLQLLDAVMNSTIKSLLWMMVMNLPFILIFIMSVCIQWVSAYVCRYTCTCTHVSMEAREQSWVFFLRSLPPCFFFFWGRDFYWTRSYWQTSPHPHPQELRQQALRTTCLQRPSSEVTNMCHWALLFFECLF